MIQKAPRRPNLRHAELRNFLKAEHIMGMPALSQRRWTAADVRDLMDESRAWPRYELLDGELLVTPAPEPRHQLIVGELFVAVRAYCDSERLGVTFTSPSDIELLDESIMQPDVFVVPNDTIPSQPPMRWPHVKRLLLAAEVLSPSSMRQDRVLKREFYLSHGVSHYWVVDPDARVFECWTTTSERPDIVRDVLTWQPRGASSRFTLDVKNFFGVRCRLPRSL